MQGMQGARFVRLKNKVYAFADGISVGSERTLISGFKVRKKVRTTKFLAHNHLDLFLVPCTLHVNLSWQCSDDIFRQHDIAVSLRFRLLPEEEHIDDFLSLCKRSFCGLSLQPLQ